MIASAVYVLLGAQGIAAYVGHPHALGEVYNAASLLADGAVQFTAHKQALPNFNGPLSQGPADGTG